MSVRTLVYSVAICILCLFAPLVPSPLAAFAAATITVNTTADDANSCTATHCSLRAALIKADGDISGDTINFTIPAGDPGCAGTPHVCTIFPLTPLPSLTASRTRVNGYSQPHATPNTHLATSRTGGDTAVILIQLDGSALSPPQSGDLYGLDVTGANNKITGLSITSFPNEVGLEGDGAAGNVVAGNFLGIAPKGATSTAGSVVGVKSDPTSTAHHAGANTIGGATAAAANLIDTETLGVDLSFRDGTVVRGNFLGMTTTGSSALPSNGSGIVLSTSDSTHIIGNIVTGYGTSMRLTNSNALRIASNIIGTRATGDVPMGGFDILTISGGSGAVVGGTSAADGNQFVGTEVAVESTDGATISHNLIGADSSGVHVLRGGSLFLESNNTANHNQPVTVLDNVIAAGQLQGAAVEIDGDNSTRLQGNMIGVDKTGKVSFHTGAVGVLVTLHSTQSSDVTASNIAIGGPNTGDGNVISGNAGAGIRLEGVAGATVQGNRIGTDVTGTAALGNAGTGIDIEGATGPKTHAVFAPTNILIGGTETGDGNVISGNDSLGVEAFNGAAFAGSVTVQGNHIGTDAGGRHAIPNGSSGVNLENLDSATVGGSAVGAGNEIAGNAQSGLNVFEVNTSVVQGNWIGTDPTGKLRLGNGGDGIVSAPTVSALIGTPNSSSKPNVIAFNRGAGIAVLNIAGKPTTIEENAIYSNSHLGIDLDPTTGPMKDGSGGRINCLTAPTANNGIHCPTIQGASTTQIGGVAGPNERIEVFLATHDVSDIGFDASGRRANFGEGKVFLGAVTSAASGTLAGHWVFTIQQGITLKSGNWITATATDSGGDTSEFAENVQVS